MDAVLADRLTKRYGDVRAVDDLSFAVAEGEVFGFLGPNGAGKTTTIRLMLDLIRPTSGRLALLGLDARRESVAIRRQVGYLPGDLRLYDRLTARELLRYLASLRGRRGLGDAEAWAVRLGLDLDRPIRSLSKGNRQKVGLIQALAHRPRLLVLDEPTSGLDPLLQEIFGEIVREVVADGRTVFLSSHVLSEVQRIATRVAIIREGRLQLVEDIGALRARAAVRVGATFGYAPPSGAFDRVPGACELRRDGRTATFAVDGSIDPLVKALAAYEVIALDVREADLEDVFLELYRSTPDAA